ncbi:MAG: hypothetical protein JJ934_09885 [Pseudomonadales bacterium]|nr:hypothetical protein [Pseudomonadales bacterium]
MAKLRGFQRFQGSEDMGRRLFLSILCLCILAPSHAAEQWLYPFFPADNEVQQSFVRINNRSNEAGLRVPELAMILARDSEDGFNLHVDLANFQMESPAARTEPLKNSVRGHAHLYLNGVKLTRLYAKDLHLPARLFRSGMNSLQISINDHNHAVWAVGNDPIQATDSDKSGTRSVSAESLFEFTNLR